MTPIDASAAGAMTPDKASRERWLVAARAAGAPIAVE